MDFKDMSDSVLLATLDDIVQSMCKKNNFDWAMMEKKDFNRIKLELICRLSERKGVNYEYQS